MAGSGNAVFRIGITVSVSIFLVAIITLVDRAISGLGSPLQVHLHPPNFLEERSNLEFTYEFRTNSQGLRYLDIPLNSPHQDEKRILVVGDSFVEGWGVEYEDTFTAILESEYALRNQRLRFINAGFAGTGPTSYMRVMPGLADLYGVDAVIVCVYANDIHDMPDSLDYDPEYRGRLELLRQWVPNLAARISLFRRRLSESADTSGHILDSAVERARSRQIPEMRITEWKAQLDLNLVNAANDGLFNGAIIIQGLIYPEYWQDALDLESQASKVRWRNMALVLDQMAKNASELGVNFGVVFVPNQFLYNPTAHENSNPWVATGTRTTTRWLENDVEIQIRLHEWAIDSETPFLDLTPVFRAARRNTDKDLHFPLDGHWTPFGHAVAAKALSSWIESGNLEEWR